MSDPYAWRRTFGPLVACRMTAPLWSRRPRFYRHADVPIGVTFARHYCIQIGGFLR